MPAYLLQAPQGVVGDVTRPDESNVEPVYLGATPPIYGAPYKFDGSGNAIAIAASDTAAVFQGILARQAPAIAGNNSNSFSPQTPNPVQLQGGLVRGYISVICAIGTPVRGSAVYMRVVAASGKFVGDLEATADGSNNVALANCEWAINGLDSNKVTEVRIQR